MNNDQLNKNVGRVLIAVVSYAQDLTADVFAQTLRNVVFAFENPKYIEKSGKRSLTDVISSGAKLESQEVSSEIAHGFDKYARSNGVQYALQKTKNNGKRAYVMYFKSKDIDALTKAMKQYIKAKERQNDKRSVRKELEHNRDFVRENRLKQRMQKHFLKKGMTR